MPELKMFDQDGVPLNGPMADYVNAASKKVFDEGYRAFIERGVLEPRAHLRRTRAARMLAIAEWRAKEAGLK